MRSKVPFLILLAVIVTAGLVSTRSRPREPEESLSGSAVAVSKPPVFWRISLRQDNPNVSASETDWNGRTFIVDAEGRGSVSYQRFDGSSVTFELSSPSPDQLDQLGHLVSRYGPYMKSASQPYKMTINRGQSGWSVHSEDGLFTGTEREIREILEAGLGGGSSLYEIPWVKPSLPSQ